MGIEGMMRGFGFCVVVMGAMFVSAGVFASEMIYRPQNPNFGGNSLNGTFLLQQAQSQGKAVKKEQEQQMPEIEFPDLSGVGNTSPIIIIGGNGQTTIPANP
jgi:Type VIII secretion system (T8SS), CsgF protein